jgi:hypothetical protein
MCLLHPEIKIMNDRYSFYKHHLLWVMVFLLALGLAGCQDNNDTPGAVSEPELPQSSTPLPSDSPINQVAPTNTPELSTPDPDAIQAAWQSSPHADTYILDANGQNNSCARCHAPINWMPSMDDLPESCFACKFELEAPPSTIPVTDWTDIPCNICHKVDKKDNILPEYAWLEIAPLGEYAAVASPSELCLKCHAPENVSMHTAVMVDGAHAGYECTQCHSAHDTQASCDTSGCHKESTTPVAGHDADHQAVSCVACHDGSDMEVGPDEETGQWVTFESDSTGTGVDRYPHTSHNVILEVPCERCHFVDNPWGLADTVPTP